MLKYKLSVFYEHEEREWNEVVSTMIGSFFITCSMPHSMTNGLCFFGCSFSISMVKFGEKMEKSQWWPQLKDYFHMANWILNYRAGVTTQPANCKLMFPFFGL